MPLALIFWMLSVIEAASFGSTTIASVLSIRYMSWRFCSSRSLPAFWTITSAPSSWALFIKISMSRCQRSMARVSIENPIVILFSGVVKAAFSAEGCFCFLQEAEARHRRTSTKAFKNLFIFVYPFCILLEKIRILI